MKPAALVVLTLLMGCCGCTADRQTDAPTTADHPTSPHGGSVSESKTNLIACKYHPETQIFNARLSGGYYRYSAITPAIYDRFVAAGGDTTAFNQIFNGQFKAEYITEDPAWMRAGQPKDAGL